MARLVVLGQVSQHLWRVRLVGWMLWVVRRIWLCQFLEPMVCVTNWNPVDLTIEEAKKFMRSQWILPWKLLFSYENKLWVNFFRNIWRSNKSELIHSFSKASKSCLTVTVSQRLQKVTIILAYFLGEFAFWYFLLWFTYLELIRIAYWIFLFPYDFLLPSFCGCRLAGLVSILSLRVWHLLEFGF